MTSMLEGILLRWQQQNLVVLQSRCCCCCFFGSRSEKIESLDMEWFHAGFLEATAVQEAVVA